MALREILEREMEQIIFAGGMALFSRDGQAMANLLSDSLAGRPGGNVYFAGSEVLRIRARHVVTEWEAMKARAAQAREQRPYTDIEERLIKAWRKSGVSLGRLLTSATDDHALCGADSMHALTDTGLVGMVEHWAEQRARNAAAPPPCPLRAQPIPGLRCTCRACSASRREASDA